MIEQWQILIGNCKSLVPKESRNFIRLSMNLEVLGLIICHLIRSNRIKKYTQQDYLKYYNLLTDNHYSCIAALYDLYADKALLSYIIRNFSKGTQSLKNIVILLQYTTETVIANLNDENLRMNLQQLRQGSILYQVGYIKSVIIPMIKNQRQTNFLLPRVGDDIYTLVLDLDETLIHKISNKVLLRPYLHQFVQQMSKLYELVIFTSGVESYANPIIDQFDHRRYIHHRLFRQHTINGVKDLSVLGRSLNRTIIVDNQAFNYQKQIKNGIKIKDFTGDPNDNALLQLIPILKRIRTFSDVRQAI